MSALAVLRTVSFGPKKSVLPLKNYHRQPDTQDRREERWRGFVIRNSVNNLETIEGAQPIRNAVRG